MFVQPVMPVFVAWNTRQWMPVGLGSFRQRFPSWHVLVIDNNPTEGDVQFWLRDSVSLVRATEGGLTNVCLVPDGVFGLRTTPARYAADGRRLEVRRTDNESADPSCDSTDWLLPGATMPHGAHEAWDLVAARFRSTRMVLTDRLHVDLLCVLSDIPNVLVADRYGKNRSMFLTWTHQHRRSRFARNWTEGTVAEAALATSLEAESA